MREAIYALELIARELSGWNNRPSVRAALEEAMLMNPQHWASHYAGNAGQQARLRHFSLSDRVRYYWTEPNVVSAVQELFAFVDGHDLPLSLVSQYLPQHVLPLSRGELGTSAGELCRAHVRLALTPYADACGAHASAPGQD